MKTVKGSPVCTFAREALRCSKAGVADSRIRPHRKRLGVKRSQVQVLSPRFAEKTLLRHIVEDALKAGIPRWPPLQLRHAAGTEARSAGGGLDAAQARLGHKHANITQVFAEVSREKAAELAPKLG